MRSSIRRTEGATLIATVLVVMLFLAVLIATTAQLSLSARRSSADQQAAVQAQYVAESGTARAQARLNLFASLLNNAFKIPPSSGSSDVAARIAAMCGVSTLTSAPAPTGAPVKTVLCDLSKDDTVKQSGFMRDPSRVALFTDFVKDDSYSTYGLDFKADGDGDPSVGGTAASEKTFWQRMFSGSTGVAYAGALSGGNYSVNFGLQPGKIERVDGLTTTSDSYIIHLSLPTVQSDSSMGAAASRRMRLNTSVTDYQFTIDRPSFAKYALFTNHHFASASDEQNGNRITFTSNTLFSGPVHTNQRFNFQGTPYFGGQVTSAGCRDSSIVVSLTGTSSCSSTNPGAFFFSTFFRTPAQMSPNDRAPSYSCATGEPPCVNPQFQGGVKWDSDFLQLPSNSNDQRTAALFGNAQGQGLYLAGDVSNLSLAVGNVDGQKAQLINYTLGGNQVQLAVLPDHTMNIRDGGSWKPAQQDPLTGQWKKTNNKDIGTFNGVIYAEGNVQNLNGPARTNAAAASSAAPAVADFAQLTVAAAGDVHITSDLQYEDPPCSGSNSVQNGVFVTAPCNNRDATNILGVYSSTGDVLIDSKYCNPSATPADPTCNASGLRTTPSVPANVAIHAVLMASGSVPAGDISNRERGRVTVNGFDQGPADNSLGQVNLLGGVIENYYGAFGKTDGKGFGRNFVYDPRTGDGVAPPSFPTQQAWQVATQAGSVKTQILQLDGAASQASK